MLYGIIIGICGIISYIYTNNGLYKKYYINENHNENHNEKLIYKRSNQKINESINYKFNHPFNIIKYTKKQKIHYFFTLLSIICINTIAFESYFNNYTKLYTELNYSELIYVPINITISLLTNSTIFYFYHRLVHTKYIYKYIHIYHHAYIYPEPFDSLIGHPIDHIIAGFCQILPMYIYRMHLITFLIYVSFISTIGIYEHSGLDIKYIGYNTIDHHIHHKYPSKNYQAGFPILICDKLFGTYKN